MSRRIRRPSFLPTQLPLIIEEFDHNRPRSEAAVTTSVLDRLRQLRRELHEYAGDKHEHIWLAETAAHPARNATAPQNFREIDELLGAGTILEPAEPDYARAVQRGLGKRAPFTSDENSVADALFIEIYASRISGTDGSDVYVFVTSNYRDFSVPNGDRRHPPPDLAGLFDGTRSRYAYEVEVLLEQFGDEYLEEQGEVEFLVSEEEPRTLAEIIEAAQEFFDKVCTYGASRTRTTSASSLLTSARFRSLSDQISLPILRFPDEAGWNWR